MSMPLAQAQGYAEKVLEWLGPFCERIEVAGSIRRRRPEVNDVDIVVIPKVTEQRDLLGQVVATQNHCLEFIRGYVLAKNPTHQTLKPGFKPHFRRSARPVKS